MMTLIVLLYVLLGAASLAFSYYFYCIPQALIAKKLGHKDVWMAYVAFARNVQRMKMLGMPTWKLMFVGGVFTTSVCFGALFLLVWACGAINPIFALFIAVMLFLAYLVFWFLCTYDYSCRLASKFGFDRVPTALILMFAPGLSQVFMYLIALSDRYYVGAPAKAAPVSGGAAVAAAPVADTSAIGLLGVSGMYQGAKFTMKPGDEFVIGRDGTLSNIIISTNGDKVSRRHCTVTFNSATCRYEVTDFSSNGTYYGNERLLKGQATQIARGTTIVIGDKMNQFKLM